MYQQIIRISIVLLSLFSFAANADPITFEIEAYSEGNYSASWLHSADYCGGSGPTMMLPLCMGGNTLLSIFGSIEGNLVADVLTITGGQLSIGGNLHDVTGGVLSAFVGLGTSEIEIDTYGTFVFENIGMGTGLPNYFDGEELILWGQNLDAYYCPTITGCMENTGTWGIDLYGKSVSVPEPGTLTLFGLGLIGMGFARRKTA